MQYSWMNLHHPSSRGQQSNTRRQILTVLGGKDFLVCDQFLTKTHDKVDVLWSSALCLLPLLIIPVVYSIKRTGCYYITVK